MKNKIIEQWAWDKMRMKAVQVLSIDFLNNRIVYINPKNKNSKKEEAYDGYFELKANSHGAGI